MKKIKLLFVIMTALFVINVNAFELNKTTGLVEVGGVALFEKGQKTNANVKGATLSDSEVITLTITKDLELTNGMGIKIMNMGDNFKLIIDNEVSYNVTERNDGIFISSTNVVMSGINDAKLTINPEEGSGIIVDGSSGLHIKDIELNVTTVRFGDGNVEVNETTQITDTAFYKNGEKVNIGESPKNDSEITPQYEPKQPDKTDNQSQDDSQRKDSFANITVYAIVAGLLIVCGIVVLLTTIKNQKK